MRVHVARPSDRETIIQIVNQVAQEGVYLQTDAYQATPAWERLLAEGIHYDDDVGFVLLVAEADGQVVGFARLIAGAHGAKDRHVGNTGVVVRREWRGQGVGAKLLGELVGLASSLGCSKLTAEIIASNKPSLHLFKKFDFEPEGLRRKQFLINGQYIDEILMSKWL